MKNLYRLLAVCIFIFSLSACKKGANPITDVSITGKWMINKYSATSYKNGVLSPTSYSYNVSDTSQYYLFDNDGTAFETFLDPNFVSPEIFYYHINGSNLILSRTLALLPETTCTISILGANRLVLQGSYTYQTSGDDFKVVNEVNLSKK